MRCAHHYSCAAAAAAADCAAATAGWQLSLPHGATLGTTHPHNAGTTLCPGVKAAHPQSIMATGNWGAQVWHPCRQNRANTRMCCCPVHPVFTHMLMVGRSAGAQGSRVNIRRLSRSDGSRAPVCRFDAGTCTRDCRAVVAQYLVHASVHAVLQDLHASMPDVMAFAVSPKMPWHACFCGAGKRSLLLVHPELHGTVCRCCTYTQRQVCGGCRAHKVGLGPHLGSVIRSLVLGSLLCRCAAGLAAGRIASCGEHGEIDEL
jgi:hypothetical protein